MLKVNNKENIMTPINFFMYRDSIANLEQIQYINRIFHNI